ncbi:hypothetical protein O9K51_11111 [Purpureocillium lavendulum]|uniref:Uncharacterized protein n=1 Tax=Purpureocillium lavendulum TaxID=1247861 RepID=A0AB34FCU9_9HYPO|nr:hypothetical protein O9K51_11111 [Purpureocillium lavendulum]
MLLAPSSSSGFRVCAWLYSACWYTGPHRPNHSAWVDNVNLKPPAINNGGQIRPYWGPQRRPSAWNPTVQRDCKSCCVKRSCGLKRPNDNAKQQNRGSAESENNAKRQSDNAKQQSRSSAESGYSAKQQSNNAKQQSNNAKQQSRSGAESENNAKQRSDNARQQSDNAKQQSNRRNPRLSTNTSLRAIIMSSRSFGSNKIPA